MNQIVEEVLAQKSNMKRLLIVDNDADLLDLVCLTAETFNMSPKGLLNGKDIFSALEFEQFDLILMDVYLGEVDGRDLSRQLKSNQKFKHIPVVLYSAGKVSLESLAKSLAEAFVEKPFNVRDLIYQIEALMIPSSTV